MKLLTAIGIKLASMLKSFWGIMIIIGTWIAEFIGGYELAIWSVLVTVILDLIWGVWASIVRGKFAKSELFRETITKITAYATALLVFILCEKNIPGDTFFIVSIIATIMCGTELWSMSANILIVAPKAVFFKLLKPALKSEIASKLHVSEEEVDKILDNKQ